MLYFGSTWMEFYSCNLMRYWEKIFVNGNECATMYQRYFSRSIWRQNNLRPWASLKLGTCCQLAMKNWFLESICWRYMVCVKVYMALSDSHSDRRYPWLVKPATDFDNYVFDDYVFKECGILSLLVTSFRLWFSQRGQALCGIFVCMHNPKLKTDFFFLM